MTTACIMLVDDTDGTGFQAARMLDGGGFAEVADLLHRAYDELWRREGLLTGGAITRLAWNPGDADRAEGPPAPASLAAAYAEGFDNYYLYVYDDGTWRWRTPVTPWFVIDYTLIHLLDLEPGPSMDDIGNSFRLR